MTPDNPAAYGDAFADVYDSWYGDTTELATTVEALTRLAGAGPVLELGVGTGRIAIPLAQNGVEVHGVDASVAMLEVGRTKDGWQDLTVMCADMCFLPIAGSYRAAFIAFNTLCNLTTEHRQRTMLAEAARVLAQDGLLIIDLFVPAPEMEPLEDQSSQRPAPHGGTITTSSTVTPTRQLVSGNHLHTDIAGLRSNRSWEIRYIYPDQLDDLCADVGLHLESRWSDWSGAEFEATSDRHVSIYRTGA